MKKVMTQEKVDCVREKLKCSHSVIRSICGLSEKTYAQLLSFSWGETRKTSFGLRLEKLLAVVDFLLEKRQIDDLNLICRSMVAPRFPLLDGTYVDVASGIHMGYSIPMLIVVADFVFDDLQRSRVDQSPIRCI